MGYIDAKTVFLQPKWGLRKDLYEKNMLSHISLVKLEAPLAKC